MERRSSRRVGGLSLAMNRNEKQSLGSTGWLGAHDRVVQTAALLILEPIFDNDFLDCSHGFRLGRSAQDAIEEVQANLRKDFVSVYDADLQGYFDSIRHDKLMKGLEARIEDNAMLHLFSIGSTEHFIRRKDQQHGQKQGW